ncbi:MAG: Fur family transcriptional regulator [Promethearchaeota archaeon]
MDIADNEMARALQDAGYRLTQPRLAVLRVLDENREYLSPQEICQRGKEVYKGLGLVTVYRTLEILDELGLARRVHTRDRCHGYARAEGDKHYLVCRRCERVVEFPCEGLEDLIEGVRQSTGYAIDAHLLELAGLCPDCQGTAA